MDSLIKEKLEEKGIRLSDNMLQEVQNRWKSVNDMRVNITKPLSSITDIAIQNIPRGDYIDK